MELMSTIVARADCRSRGSAAWVTRSVPRTLVAYIRSHSCGSPSSTRVTPSAPPALLTTTSQRPSDATPVVTDSGSVTSMTRARADPPPSSMLATTSSSFSRRRPATTTWKPSCDSRLATAAPMPVPPPVMRAVGRDWSLLRWSLVTPPRIGVAAGSADQEAGGRVEVGGSGHLQGPHVSLDDEDPLAEALDETGVVRG